MLPFSDGVIQPLIAVARPKTIVEIGAFAGAHTLRLLRWARANRAVVHTIDPKPIFDVDELQQKFGSAFVMHRALSLDALPAISNPDLVLIDGDHNWYTVFEELRLVERSSRRFPLVVLHDVDWPYGRRDQYYEPSNIPAEHRQPIKQSGVILGQSKLSPKGMNPDYFHADHEGGPRNGVLTAVEDFLDSTKIELELFHARGPAGLGLLIERSRLINKDLRSVVKKAHDPAHGEELSPNHVSRYFDRGAKPRRRAGQAASSP